MNQTIQEWIVLMLQQASLNHEFGAKEMLTDVYVIKLSS